LEAKTIEDLDKKRAGIESLGGGPAIWSQRTYHLHDDLETFGSLFDQHRQRVERDVAMAGPEGIKTWIRSVMEASTVGVLASYVKSYRETERFQAQECEAALHERALQLGLQSYTDCEADEHGLTDRDYTDKAG
jgi:hypothetical protein